jgi:NAD(P)-dependent dehydrogenase (short-subunit alcohol dehydrogenase family)
MHALALRCPTLSHTHGMYDIVRPYHDSHTTFSARSILPLTNSWAQGDWITKLATEGSLDRVAMVDEVARLVDFFAGAGGAFVTGQILGVDGGAGLSSK